jgi:fatty-acyl-CoA synthase
VNLLIGDAVADAAVLAPHATAATLGDDTISFGALDVEANRVAHAVQGLGVQHGDLVAWWAGSSLRSLSGLLACARLGAIFAPISPLLETAEAAGVLDYVDPRLVVADGPRRDAAHDTGRPVTTIDDLHELARTASPAPVASEVRDTDPHILHLTSGSTGRPKGVLVSHRATWLRSAPGAGTFAGTIRGDGGVLSSFPLYHYGGWHYVIEAWLHRTAVHLGCLRHADTGTSRVADDLIERLRRRAPDATTTVLYGSSEAGPMAALRHWQLAEKRGSVGRPIAPGVLTLAPDGEILFRGPTLMDSYLRLPAETAAAVRDGWYHSGDLGVRDDDGFVFITGRTREVIRSGGETVAPAEVEAALLGLPGIADVAVVGLPDDRWGEVVCAVVVPEPGVPVPDVGTLRPLLTGLAAFKHPRRVVAVAAIPRTPATGQVMRSAVREAVLREKEPA